MGNCFKPSANPSAGGAQAFQNPPQPNTERLQVPSEIQQSASVSSQLQSLTRQSSSAASLREPSQSMLRNLVNREILSDQNVKEFSFDELKDATNNFGAECLIGRGGFAEVYKARVKEDTSIAVQLEFTGTVVAVKKFDPSKNGSHEQWEKELDCLRRLKHPNIVRLIGYSSEGADRLIVYEYLKYGSLANHLFERDDNEPSPLLVEKRRALPWAVRFDIAVSVAHGLAYMHGLNPPMIWRDAKSTNILLDEAFVAKLSDFGTAREGPVGDESHVLTRLLGTRGYIAPEYGRTGFLTIACDVFSFGVVLIELLTGRKAFDKTKCPGDECLVFWAENRLGKIEKLTDIMDLRMKGRYPRQAAFGVSYIAEKCIKLDISQRPSMSEVCQALLEIRQQMPGEFLDKAV